MSNEKYHLLVVDDEDAMRRSLADILRLEGYQVTTAANGDASITLLQSEVFDLVLLDLKMPGIDGLEVLRFITGNQPHRTSSIPPAFLHHGITPPSVILLTAHGSLESAIEALRHGAFDYLLKPASPAQILQSVTRGLETRDQLIQKRALLQQLEHSVRQLVGVDDKSGSKFSQVNLTETNQISLPNGAYYDLARREIHDFDQVIILTPAEGKLFRIFLENPKRVFSHKELVLLVQGYQTKDWEAPEVLRPLISRLRKKISHIIGGNEWITNVRGTGYTYDISRDTQA